MYSSSTRTTLRDFYGWSFKIHAQTAISGCISLCAIARVPECLIRSSYMSLAAWTAKTRGSPARRIARRTRTRDEEFTEREHEKRIKNAAQFVSVENHVRFLVSSIVARIMCGPMHILMHGIPSIIASSMGRVRGCRCADSSEATRNWYTIRRLSV